MYDIIIIGGGPAGLNAGLYACRGGMKTLLIERLFCGGQAATTYEVDNYIGFGEPLSGPELVMRMEEHAKRFGLEIFSGEVTAVDFGGGTKKVSCNQDLFESKAVIVCTGAAPRQLDVPGEVELRGSGVSYCATCDGAFFRNREVAVVGGGDTAAEDALYLSRFCSKVYLIHRRDTLRAAKTISDKVLQTANIQPVWDSVVTSVNGSGAVSSVSVKHIKTNENSDIPVSAVFIAVGTIATNELIQEGFPLKDGYIVTDENMHTGIKGVFAAGDIRSKILRQIITAASDGAIAAHSAINYILAETE